MAKPIVKPIAAFDATQDCIVSFVWSGNMAYNNRLTIYEAETQAIIYQHTYDEKYYALDHVIPAKQLANDSKYCLQIEVIDIDGNISSPSDKIYFWTVTKPKLYFSDLQEDALINSSSLRLELEYDNQDGFEDLAFIRYHLYDSNKRVVKETDEDKSCSLTYTFRALANNTSYYVRVTAMTIHNMALDTGYVRIKVSYRNPNSYARLYVENDEHTGFVHYKSNIVVISPDRDNYDYDGGYIDLSEPNSEMTFHLSTISATHPGLSVSYINLDDMSKKMTVEDGNSDILIQGYQQIKSISLFGRTEPQIGDLPNQNNYLRSVENCKLVINNHELEDITDGFALRGLPSSNGDSLDINAQNGNRQITIRTGFHIFADTDKAVYTEQLEDAFVTYYAVNARIRGLAQDIYCDQIAVNSGSGTTISLDPETGYLKIVWRADSGVTNETEAQRFFADYHPSVIYPLQKETVYQLSSVSIPDSTNQNILRYSSNFKIPSDSASFVIKMTQCYRTVDLMRVFKGKQITFLLRAMFDEEDATVRFKLTVYGSGSNYTMYSDALDVDPEDIVYICIKRKLGVYSLTAFKDDEPIAAGLWLTKDMPTLGLHENDAWIDLEQGEIYIDKAVSQLTNYCSEEPDNDELYTVWIGD